MRIEINHDYPLVQRQLPQGGVRDVPGRVAERVRRGVRENDGRLRDVQGVAHRPDGDVRQIDDHPETVHLLDDALEDNRQCMRIYVLIFRRKRELTFKTFSRLRGVM